MVKAKQFVINLNIFRTDADDLNNVQLAIDQRLSTRLFLVSLVSILCVLVIYSFATLEIREETLLYPTESKINSLENIHSISLTCPCVNTTIPYNMFTSLEPHYHQLCSSIFIDEPWFALIIIPSAKSR